MRIKQERPDPESIISDMTPEQLTELDHKLDTHNEKYGTRAFSESVISSMGSSALTGLFLTRQIQRNDLARQAGSEAWGAQ